MRHELATGCNEVSYTEPDDLEEYATRLLWSSDSARKHPTGWDHEACGTGDNLIAGLKVKTNVEIALAVCNVLLWYLSQSAAAPSTGREP